MLVFRIVRKSGPFFPKKTFCGNLSDFKVFKKGGVLTLFDMQKKNYIKTFLLYVITYIWDLLMKLREKVLGLYPYYGQM